MKLQSKNRNIGGTHAASSVAFSFAQHVKRPTTTIVQTLVNTRPTLGKRSRRKTSSWWNRIKSAVNSALAAKGWTEVPSGGDVEVFCH